MANNTPKISFRFPYRWLTDKEDREYLGKNIVSSVRRNEMKLVMHPDLPANSPAIYSVVLKYIHYKPVNIPLTKNQIEKILSGVFPGARCGVFDTEFVQRKRTVLDSGQLVPVMELNIFY